MARWWSCEAVRAMLLLLLIFIPLLKDQDNSFNISLIFISFPQPKTVYFSHKTITVRSHYMYSIHRQPSYTPYVYGVRYSNWDRVLKMALALQVFLPW